MPDAGASTYRSARLLAPYQLVRGQTQTLTCPVYAGGVLVAPTSGTITVERPGGTELVSAASAPVAGDMATYSLTSATLADTEQLGGQWQVIWSLVFASGVTPEVVRSDAVVVRRALYPTVTDADLYRRASALDPAGSAPVTSETTYQDKIDLAWGMILREIINEGRRPDLVTTPSALHDAHLLLTLSLIYEDMATRLNEFHMSMADRYRDAYRAARQSMSYGYDADDTGKQPERRTRRGGTLWLGGSPYT